MTPRYYLQHRRMVAIFKMRIKNMCISLHHFKHIFHKLLLIIRPDGKANGWVMRGQYTLSP